MIREVLFGVAVGDALGVPVEFLDRETLLVNPVTDMKSGGTHGQVRGTFSDDSSLCFCQAEALIGTYSLRRLADLFIEWKDRGYWSAHGEVFDIGAGTRSAIERLKTAVDPVQAGGRGLDDNGNGSLMRILPLLLLTKDKPIAERYRLTMEASSVTHAHVRSVICCFYYLELARLLATGMEKFAAYNKVNYECHKYLEFIDVNPIEIAQLNRLWNGNLHQLNPPEINSTGYVLDSLEAAVWCLLTTGNYEQAVLKAVNLGEDTDTTGAISGGLAALVYGYGNIPGRWVDVLAKKEEIEDLAVRMTKQFPGVSQ